MSQNVTESLPSSNYVVDDWENSGEEVEKQVQERFKQVRIQQREKADKEALIAKVRAEDKQRQEMAQATGLSPSSLAADLSSSTSSAVVQPPPQMKILRRPKPDQEQSQSTDNSEAGGGGGGSGAETQNRQPVKPSEHTDETAAQHEANEEARKAKTLEARQAAYDEARQRILGSNYNPDDSQMPQITLVDRSKSPEQIRVPNYPRSDHTLSKQPQPHMPGGGGMWAGRSASSPNTFMQAGTGQAAGGMPPFAMPTMHQHMAEHSSYSLATLGYTPHAHIDTSRPPPPLPPQFYVGGPSPPIPAYGRPPPPHHQASPIVTASTNVPYGRPPIAIYPVSLAANTAAPQIGSENTRNNPGESGKIIQQQQQQNQSSSGKKSRNRNKKKSADPNVNANQ